MSIYMKIHEIHNFPPISKHLVSSVLSLDFYQYVSKKILLVAVCQ